MLIRFIDDRNIWPMPFYLRGFTNVGYYTALPDEPDAALIITSPDLAAALEARLKGAYAGAQYFGLRPDVMLVVYIHDDLWRGYLDAQSR